MRMLLAALLMVAVQGGTKAWYGPVTATFNVMFGGNPYDPDVNDVRVQFLGPTGAPIERLAYFDGEGAYKAVLVAPMKGHFKATLFRNGQKMLEQPQEGLLDAETPLPHGYVHPDPAA